MSDSYQLPFNPQKQLAVLGHLLTNPKFFLRARHRVRPTWFVDPHAAKVWIQITRWHDKFGLVPSISELVCVGDFVSEDAAVRERMRAVVIEAQTAAQNFALAPLSLELQQWLQATMFEEAMGRAQSLFNSHKLEDCYAHVGTKIDEIRKARFVEDGEWDFENFDAEIGQEEVDRENACTLGIDLLDQAVLDGATHGGLLPGAQTVFLGATNAGKSRAMITVIKANLLRRKSILWLAHEGIPNDLSLLLRCSLLNVSRKTLFDFVKDSEGRKLIQGASAAIKKYVTFIPYIKAGMTVEDVEPIVRTKCEERVAETGKGYDLFVNDYPAKLTTRMASGGQMQPRYILDHVYDVFVNLASEYRYHSLVGYQATREGSKAVQGSKQERSRFLTQDDMAEASGPGRTAANVISINRPPELKDRNLVAFHVSKSRSSETGQTVVCKSNYGHAITHSNDLGGFKYRGNTPTSEQLSDFLDGGVEVGKDERTLS